MRARFQSKLSIVMLGTLLLLLPGWTTALHSGVGGPQQFLDSDGNNVPIDDVSKEGADAMHPIPTTLSPWSWMMSPIDTSRKRSTNSDSNSSGARTSEVRIRLVSP